MWDTILELDADIVDAYADYSSVAEKRQVLDIKMRKLICVAIDSITGCLNANGLKNHMKHSLQAGHQRPGDPGDAGDHQHGGYLLLWPGYAPAL